MVKFAVFLHGMIMCVYFYFVAVSLMPVADRPASTGDVSASPISRCHSYDLRVKSFSVPALKHGRASMATVDSPSSASPFIPSKRRRLSSYSSTTSQSGKFWNQWRRGRGWGSCIP